MADGLAAFERSWSAALVTAGRELSRAVATCQASVASSAQALRAATRTREEAELELRRADPPSSHLQEALRRATSAELAARQAHERARAAARRVEVAAQQLTGALRSAEAGLERVPTARGHVVEYARHLQSYLATRSGV
jgi:hypothetical protein